MYVYMHIYIYVQVCMCIKLTFKLIRSTELAEFTIKSSEPTTESEKVNDMKYRNGVQGIRSPLSLHIFRLAKSHLTKLVLII